MPDIRITISRMGFVESYRCGLPLSRRWHWTCETCALTDGTWGFGTQRAVELAIMARTDKHRTWGFRTQRQAKLAILGHIDERHPKSTATT